MSKFGSASDYYDEHHDEYAPARLEAFKEFIEDQVENYCENIEDDGTISVVDFADEISEEFTFPDVGDWLASQYESMIGDYEDQKYDEMRDRQMMGDD